MLTRFAMFLRLALVAILLAFFTITPKILAFSAYGAGTASNPYRIANCTQLEEVQNDPAGHYVLVANIDCTGTTFTAISATFTGVLDGQNHTVAHLNIDSSGLFSDTSGAVIKNLALASGTITNAGGTGSVVDSAHNTTLTNVHSSITITGTSDNGGLVGVAFNDLTIESSSYSGSLTSSVFSGGLVGIMYDTGVNLITDSFFDGTFTLIGTTFPFPQSSFDNGGLVGLMYGGTVSNSYSAATINYDNGADVVGGLAGVTYNGIFNNDFAASTISGSSGSSIGGAFGAFYTGGSFSSARSNIFYDQHLANNGAACGGFDEGSGNCTAENIGNATPGYFKNNSVSGPFGAWDFTHTWTTSAGYPVLRSAQAFAAPTGIPNSGDANDDGVADSYQANVANIKDAGGIWSTVAIPSSSDCTFDNAQSLATGGLKIDIGHVPQVNFVSFGIYCAAAGVTVPVTIIYDHQYNVRNSVLRYYNPNTQQYSTVPNAIFSTVTISGVVKTTVTYNITDGGTFDQDGSANGVIIDPVGIATISSATTLTAPDTGFGTYQDTSWRNFIAIGLASFVVAVGLVARRSSQRYL